MKEYLNTVGIERLSWPARSLDTNCNKHLWDLRKQRIRARNHPHTNLNELEAAALEEWQNIAQETIQRLFHSMPRQMEAVIRSRRGMT